MPTVEIMIPRVAAITVFIGFLPVIPPRVAKASRNNAKYSAGPKLKANLASTGASMINPIVPISPPAKDAIAEIASASAARPFWAMG